MSLSGLIYRCFAFCDGGSGTLLVDDLGELFGGSCIFGRKNDTVTVWSRVAEDDAVVSVGATPLLPGFG